MIVRNEPYGNFQATYQQSRAAYQAHEVVIPGNLYSFLDGRRCTTATLDDVCISGGRLRTIRAELVTEEDWVYLNVSICRPPLIRVDAYSLVVSN